MSKLGPGRCLCVRTMGMTYRQLWVRNGIGLGVTMDAELTHTDPWASVCGE